MLDTFQQFLDREVANGAAAHDTRVCYLRLGKQFLAFAEGKTINKDLALDYRAHLIRQGYAQGTVALHLRVASRVCQALLNAGTIEKNPFQGVQAPRPRTSLAESTTYLDKEQAVRFMQEAAADGIRTQAIACLMLFGAARVVEIQRAQLGDWHKDELRLRGKGHDRIIYLREDVREVLERWLVARPEGGTALFTWLRTSHNLTRHHIALRIRRCLAQAGVVSTVRGRIRPHSLRHTFATLALAEGVDIAAVKEAGGWWSLGGMQRYTHATEEHKRRVAENIPVKAD